MEYLNKYNKEIPDLKKSTLDALHNFFGKSIELRVSDKIRNEIAEIFKEQLEYGRQTYDSLLAAKTELEKQINLAKTDLRNAKKLFKKGEMNRDTLFDYEYRIIELRLQLDEIINKLNK